ncbi:metal ABC transporter permease [Candidatus Gracilibacteria bacterium]|nr:metal ABC transporter permease [Candidatus Gracilibacteria bacterium]
MFEILSYSFFQKALVAGLLVSLISGSLGTLVVLRREPNITHAISNILFLGIVISLFFSGNYYIFGILFALLGVIFLGLLEKYSSTSRESTKEILAQIGLAAGIFCVGLLGNVQLDVFNFLFGNILFVNASDIILLVVMLIIGGILGKLFGKKLLRITLSPDIAKSQGINVSLYEFGYLLYLALFIAFSVKIFGVMLLGAFLVLPANIGKSLSRSLSGVFIIATIISLIAVVTGLFASYYFDTSAGASIVLILGLFFFLSLLKRR